MRARARLGRPGPTSDHLQVIFGILVIDSVLCGLRNGPPYEKLRRIQFALEEQDVPDAVERAVGKTYNISAESIIYKVANDSHDNIIACVANKDADNNWYPYIVKFNENGNEIWKIKYSYGSFPVSLWALALDKNDNIIAGGSYSDGSQYPQNSLIVKFDPDGRLIWERPWDYNHINDDISGVAVDSNQNIIAVGTHYSNWQTYDHDYFLLKLDPQGNILFTREYSTYGHDMCTNVTVDLNDAIILVGQSPYYGIHAVKFDSSGNRLWSNAYYTGRFGSATAAVSDQFGNIYVTGNYDDWTGIKYRTVKFDANGNILWVKDFGSGIAYAIALDGEGNILVTGTNLNDIYTVVYDPGGNELSSIVYDSGASDYAYRIAVDSQGNVFLGGYTYSQTSGYQGLLLKYGRNAQSNNSPVADAGLNQTVQKGASVQLNGANSSDPDGVGDIVSYQWEQLSGPSPVTLSDPTAVAPTFTAPDVGPEGASLEFRLTVTDKGGLSSQATCLVTVTR